MPKKALTDRQREILDFIIESMQTEGYPPTIREIMTRFHISSTNGVKDHLLALQRKGVIRLKGRTSRGIEVLNRPMKWGQEIGVPLVGRIAAGQPILAIENIEDRLTMEKIFPADGRIFALRVKGDSMIEDGIYDGDIIIVRPQPTAERGEIVVALIDGEATVKRYFREQSHIRLEPANPMYEPIIVGDVEIVGKVIGVVRRMH